MNLLRITIAFSSLILALMLIPGTSFADPSNLWNSGRPDSHAPIGVMGDHVHDAGEFMLSYRFMYMPMGRNRDGSSSVDTEQVLEDFPVTPTEMSMLMHMFGFMFAPSDFFTLMVGIPYIELSMDHVTRAGGKFTTKANGLGDLRVTGLVTLLEEVGHKIHLNAGVSLPSGDINRRDDTPVMSDAPLPYPMQLGSGTVDLLPGVTYVGQNLDLSWGSQLSGTVRLGENSNDYTLGNRIDWSSWGAYQIQEWISASLRTRLQRWGNIDGADPRLNPNSVPTADPDRRGGTRLDLGLGINLYAPSGTLQGGRLAAEFLVPIYQDLDGPQLEVNPHWIFGWQQSW